MKTEIRIGTRGSRLALAQTESVRDQLARLHTEVSFNIEVIKTTGDVLKTAPLTLIGGQGVFTKELEDALLSKRIDLAVHSLKDLPTVVPSALTLAAIPAREDAQDALIFHISRQPFGKSIADKSSIYDLKLLPHKAIIGTSSLRRAAQLQAVRPDFIIKELRGNVDTRLRKLDEREYDAIILAAAGLRRLGLAARINETIDTQIMLPAIGQGALGLECRADDETTINLARALDDAETRAACTAERALLRQLGGGCQLPIAGYAKVQQNRVFLRGKILNTHGTTSLASSIEGATVEAEALGVKLANELIARGAESLLNPAMI